MRGRFRVPLPVITLALLGLIVLLATLQYRWLGQISNAERDRMRATLGTDTSAFAQEFDAEIARAYLLFQVEPAQPGESVAARLASRYERWQATSPYPRMIKELYFVDGAAKVQRFDPASRFVEPAEWPDALKARAQQLTAHADPPGAPGTLVVRSLGGPIWEDVPALAIPTPLLIAPPRPGTLPRGGGTSAAPQVHFITTRMAYTVLVLDRDYIAGEMLPALAGKHFRGTSDGLSYKLAVVSAGDRRVLYRSSADFAPAPDAAADATAALLQLRPQEFSSIAAEVRRFVAASAPRPADGAEPRLETFKREVIQFGAGSLREGAPVSIVVQQEGRGAPLATALGAVSARVNASSAPSWRLLVKHPRGSLEAAVVAARRRNLLVSSSILAVLGASVGLLVLSTRRAQKLARQQMEFVATVTHELRTPLAVIRSAGDNLADGVVRDHEQIRKYGDLVRNEGRRLSEMVEQVLEFAGIQSGQRGFALRPVPIAALLNEVVSAAATIAEGAGVTIERDIPPALPAVLGDEPALRRALQNLVGNAMKYGADGQWIRVSARGSGGEVTISVGDRGIGIAPADQPHIFEPFYRAQAVVDAQIQGAGLGLSLVKRIVEAHGGRVEVRSALAQGSDFTVTLPAAAGEA